MTNTNKKLKKKGTKRVQQTIEKIKNTAKKTPKKIDQFQKSPLGKKVKKAITQTTKIATSHLATLKTAFTLSNQEAELIEKIKVELNKNQVYPSKSEIIRAGLWSLRSKKPAELEEIIKDLIKVKQTRVL